MADEIDRGHKEPQGSGSSSRQAGPSSKDTP